jgi:hypothetical protein
MKFLVPVDTREVGHVLIFLLAAFEATGCVVLLAATGDARSMDEPKTAATMLAVMRWRRDMGTSGGMSIKYQHT